MEGDGEESREAPQSGSSMSRVDGDARGQGHAVDHRMNTQADGESEPAKMSWPSPCNHTRFRILGTGWLRVGRMMLMLVVIRVTMFMRADMGMAVVMIMPPSVEPIGDAPVRCL